MLFIVNLQIRFDNIMPRYVQYDWIQNDKDRMCIVSEINY